VLGLESKSDWSRGGRVTLAQAPRFSPTWLELREPADAAARATALLDPLRHYLAGVPTLVIRDLGSGTGSMQRWLAGRLNGEQRWILQDHDPELLDFAWTNAVDTSADGAPVTVETQQGDLTRLTAADLSGASLVTGSALLDLLTIGEVDQLAAACVTAGVPALFTLSVIGRVELNPAEPLDAALSAAFNDHLHHGVDSRGGETRRLLGPDAAEATAEAFARHGATVRVRHSPWHLGADHAPLIAEWLHGWVPAAVARRPGLTHHADAYLHRRLAAASKGELEVTVHHTDLLALP
jgi:hypothetical protein